MLSNRRWRSRETFMRIIRPMKEQSDNSIKSSKWVCTGFSENGGLRKLSWSGLSIPPGVYLPPVHWWQRYRYEVTLRSRWALTIWPARWKNPDKPKQIGMLQEHRQPILQTIKSKNEKSSQFPTPGELTLHNFGHNRGLPLTLSTHLHNPNLNLKNENGNEWEESLSKNETKCWGDTAQ